MIIALIGSRCVGSLASPRISERMLLLLCRVKVIGSLACRLARLLWGVLFELNEATTSANIDVIWVLGYKTMMSSVSNSPSSASADSDKEGEAAAASKVDDPPPCEHECAD